MSPQQKKVFIKNHFSKQCIILLSDVRKTKCYKDLQGKTQMYVSTSGRKKHSCYICFEKFFSKEELEIHKIVHKSDSKNNTFSDDNDDCDDEERLESKKPALKDIESNMNEEICKTSNANMETTQNIEETTMEVAETNVEVAETNVEDAETNVKQDLIETDHSNYRCIKCNVGFKNQDEIKSHEHTQHWCKYHCRQCGRQFNTKGGFIVHVLQHNITNISKFSYKCSMCHLGFNDCFELQKHNIVVHNEVTKNTKPDVQLEQVNFTEVIEDSTNITVADSLDHLKKDNDNPITGSIPIYDCDICYDVFASEKSLNRHKVLHREFEKITDSYDGETIIVQDNEPEAILTENLKKVVSAESRSLLKKTAGPMAQLTPMYSGDTLPSSLVTFRPNILSTVPTQRKYTKIKPKIQPTKDATANLINDVKTLPQSTHQMLAEKQIKPKQVYPYLTSKPEILPSSSPLLLQKETTISSPTIGALQQIPKSQDSSKQTNIPLPTGPQVISDENQSQYMYVLCPQSGNVSGITPQGGQTLMMNVPGSSSPAMFSYNPQVEKNTSAIMPSSGQNQVIINQQINTGGVVINRGGLHGNTFAMDQNNGKDEQSFGCAPVEGAPMFYILLPSNQPNQELAASNQIPENSKSSPVLKNILETHLNNKKKPKSIKIIRRKKTSLSTKTDGYDPSEPLVMPIITSVTGTTIEEEEPVGKDINTDNIQETHHEDTPEMVMPIITSIGTVAEESTNTKEKIRTDPVSQYENEFAKFLQEAEKEAKPNSRKFSMNKMHTFRYPKSDITSTLTNAGTSNDDVICVDDNSSSSEHEFKKNVSNSNETPSFKITSAVEESNIEIKPKIFVKKLSDLVDKTISKNDMYMHCCLRCNSQFKDWGGLRLHVRKQHLMQACKFDMCLILSSKAEYDQHISESHRCSFCGDDFRILAAHKRSCGKRKTDIQIQEPSDHTNSGTNQRIFLQASDQENMILAAHKRSCGKRKTDIQIQEPSDHTNSGTNQRIFLQASDQENMLVLANPETNVTSEDLSCSQK